MEHVGREGIAHTIARFIVAKIGVAKFDFQHLDSTVTCTVSLLNSFVQLPASVLTGYFTVASVVFVSSCPIISVPARVTQQLADLLIDFFLFSQQVNPVKFSKYNQSKFDT